MKPYVFQHKVARIIAALAKERNITEPQALSLFYSTRTSEILHDPTAYLHLMSDLYILEDLRREMGDGRGNYPIIHYPTDATRHFGK